MSLIPPTGHAPPSRQAITQQVEKMTGMLWYQVLSSMNETGMDASSLGPGGSEFQSMFLWNIAQNDFGGLDGQMVQAALRQYGEAAPTPTGVPPALSQLPPGALESLLSAAPGASMAPVSESPLAAPQAEAESGAASDLIGQAKSFAKQIWPAVEQAAQTLGVPPVGILAQAALETGWGAAAPGHNLFGMKAAPGDEATTRATSEMVDGVLTQTSAAFKDYATPSASVQDYVRRVQDVFPGAAGQDSVDGFATALQQGGYATDSHYAAKIVSISQSPMMAQVLDALGVTATQKVASP
ncbi:glycoside hydrolase family 73 protein [Acidocella facilis]|uniref:glycoside hydrolase family 73 protein n=1 Tax=Acidocella facilis TaxID=525 RepID=UPI001F48207E|nr:glucosaminidase domain-containing protein [Acidocella facilis]